ncbi:hypothetical protein KC331_g1859 [Hortaea werneckii]|nr:hypothetical protein KC331_g1859 [Hortaea werneckii]KAI7721147.1 hypothetical protein KC353_g1597 [Hortaea werneckii]
MAGHSRLLMAGLAKLNDDQEDPDFLEKYLIPPDGLPREPETADGMLVMGMAQGDKEVLFKVPQLSERAPAVRGYAYAKLVIGKYKDFDMALSVHRIANGAFVPRVTAGRYIVGGERRLPVNEDLCTDERLLGMQIWLDTRRDTGLNGMECLQHYQNWLVRGTRNLMAGGDGVIHNGDDQKDMAGEDEDEDEKDVKERYGLRSFLAFWVAYDEDEGVNFDLDDDKVCEMIGLGYLNFKEFGETTDVPPKEVLKSAREERRKYPESVYSCEETWAFSKWVLQTTTGSRRSPEVIERPSLYELDEANRKKQQQKQELQRKEDGQWLRNYLLRNGVSEDAMRAVDKIAHRLKDVDV